MSPLNSTQETEVQQIAKESWDAHPMRPLKATRLAKQKLMEAGWEDVLIDLAIKAIIELFKQWMQNRGKQ